MKYPRFIIRVIESKEDTVEMPQLEFSQDEALDYIKGFDSEGKDLQECMCRKCGVGLRCEHKDGEPHEQYLCGNCS